MTKAATPKTMLVYRAQCANPRCQREFESKRPTARWCSQTCRQIVAAAKRKGKIPKDDPLETPPPRLAMPDDPTAPDEAHPLVVAVRADLVRANALGTFNGELALQLARRLASDESGPSSLSKELRTVMAQAVAGAPTRPVEPQPEVEPEPEPESDPIEEARRAREHARQALIGS